MSQPTIEGSCDAAFAGVRDAFAKNFELFPEEIGASVSVTIEGRSVVDLWAGHADGERRKKWDRDTIANVYSTTKGLAALCVLKLRERGLLDLDAPMAKYWPEFAAEGKGDLSVRACMAHRAGVPAVRERLSPEVMFDDQRFAAAMAAETPWWEPGTQHGYHAITYGFYASELVRRLDGRPFSQFAREEVSGPLGIDFLVGLPASEDGRTAAFQVPGPPPPGVPNLIEEELRERPESMTSHVFNNPPLDLGAVNGRDWRAATIPAANGHTNARALAKMYGGLAHGGTIDSVALLDPGLIADAAVEQSHGPDAVLWQLPTRFGCGFMLTQSELPVAAFGPNPGAFGHPGLGGSLGFGDPETQIGFGYVMNQARLGILVDDRAAKLIEATYACL